MLERHAKQSHFLTNQNFTFDHPIEMAGRYLLVALLKHLNLMQLVYSLIEKGKHFELDHTEYLRAYMLFHSDRFKSHVRIYHFRNGS